MAKSVIDQDKPKKKSNAGRPKKFKCVEDMKVKIDEYFNKCDSNIVEVYSKKQQEVITMNKPLPYTVEGLCVVLDMDRVSLLNYAKDSEFFSTIKKAKAKILQNVWDRALIGENNPAVSIFMLKNNYGYVDRTETQHAGELNIKGYDDFFTA